jgi:hypothetical protein
MLDRLPYWQRGALFSVIFSIIFSGLFAGAMLFGEHMIEKRGLKHVCGGEICSYSDALKERISYVPLIFIITASIMIGFSIIIGLIMQSLQPRA